MYSIELERQPKKFLKSMQKNERDKIIKEIYSLQEDPRKEGVVKLKNRDPSEYRTRQGDYRIVFFIQDGILKIVTITRIFIRGDQY